MDFLKPDNFGLTIYFIVPGFISMKIYSLLVPGEARDYGKSLFEIISYSCINFALFFWLIFLINKPYFSADHFAWYCILTFIILFVAPAAWAFLIKYILSSDMTRKFLGTIHPTPKAWDYRFSKGDALWVLVHMINGDMIGGKFDKDSFASSFPNAQDLYLEEVWAVDERGAFLGEQKQERSAGVLIKDAQIDYLEFFK